MMLSLYDGPTAAIVLGGTLLATLMRCGPGDCWTALLVLARCGHRRFDAEQVRAGFAGQLQDIRRDGLLRLHPRHSGDREFDEAADALIGQRSIAGLLAAHQANRDHRLALADIAANTFTQAAELAPVFGLAGTLISLSHLPSDGIDRNAYMAAIAMAVHATLYGLLAAHLVLMPLARLIERFADREDSARQQIVDWLTGELTLVIAPRVEPSPRQRREVA